MDTSAGGIYFEIDASLKELEKKLKTAQKECQKAGEKASEAFEGSFREQAESMASSLEKAYKAQSKIASKGGKNLAKLTAKALKEELGRSLADLGKDEFKQLKENVKETLNSLDMDDGAKGKLFAAFEKSINFKRLGSQIGTATKLMAKFVAASALLALVAAAVGALVLAFKVLKKTLQLTFQYMMLGFKTIVGVIKKLAQTIVATLSTAFNKAVQWAKEGFSNLAQAGGQTQYNVEMLKASILTLKNALGAMVAPIFNAVAPALNSLISMLITAANAVGKLIAAITGQQFAVAAVNTFNGISSGASGAGSSMGKAAKQAKELKRQLMGFDQINRLDDITDTSSSSGGGSGSGGVNYGDMFTTENIDTSTNKWAELIKKSWKDADFTDLGRIIGDKISNALSNIPWEKIRRTASDLGTSLATLLNGLADSNFFTSLGSTLANALNTAISGLHGFVSNLKWGELGHSVGKGIQQAISDFDWVTAGETFGRTARGMFDWLAGVVEEIDWEDLGNKIADFIISMDWEGIFDSAAKALGALGSGLANAIRTLVLRLLGIDDYEWRNNGSKKDDGGQNSKPSTNTSLYGNVYEDKGGKTTKQIDVIMDDKSKNNLNEYNKAQNGSATKTTSAKWDSQTSSSNANTYNSLTSGKAKKDIEAKLTKFDEVIPEAKKAINMLGMINNVDETQDIKSGKKTGWAYATGWLNEVTEAQAVKSGKAKGWAYATGWINDVTETQAVQKGNTRGWAYITGWIDKVEKTANAKVKFKGSLGTTQKGGEITMELAKQGGIFSAGKSERLPQGNSAHGSLVWAGEAGPEILGHFNGKTEILNRSQIAATIASGVGTMLRHFNPAPQLAFVDRQMAAQSALNAQQSQDMGSGIKLLSSLLVAVQSKDSDVYFDGTKITNEVVKNINREIRATGVSPILY